MKQFSILLKLLNHMIGFLSGIEFLFPVSILQLLKVRTNLLIIILEHVASASLFGQWHYPFAHVVLGVGISIQFLVFVFVKSIGKWQTDALHFGLEII